MPVLVEDAETIILQQCKNLTREIVPLGKCLGRVLDESIFADRDFPPFDRATMDGVAILFDAFKNGRKVFRIVAAQGAGSTAVDIGDTGECVEITTGSIISSSLDTVIPYEDIEVKDGLVAVRVERVIQWQNIHRKGIDGARGLTLAAAGQWITPAIIALAASVGKSAVAVKAFPTIIIVSTGNELVDITETPASFQIRRSNDIMLSAVLQKRGIPSETMHLPDSPQAIMRSLRESLKKYECIILVGGVSRGKMDFVPAVLEQLNVQKLFHTVYQRPGKPFWFGKRSESSVIVFALPGNPVSCLLCMYRYFLPWLTQSMGIGIQKKYAILNEDLIFKPRMQYFLQVGLLACADGRLLATPVKGNGSGDVVNLLKADAFLELPMEKMEFKKGEIFPIWTID